jgi:hypothetical protein
MDASPISRRLVAFLPPFIDPASTHRHTTHFACFPLCPRALRAKQTGCVKGGEACLPTMTYPAMGWRSVTWRRGGCVVTARTHMRPSTFLPSTHTYLLARSVGKPSPRTQPVRPAAVRGVGGAVRLPSLLHFRRKREPVTRGGSRRVGLRVTSSMRCVAQGRFLGKTLFLLGQGMGLT